MMALDRFAELLKQTMGLDAASVGPALIERAVRQRCDMTDAGDLNAYWTRLKASPTELQAMIEAVVVPETWFFRGRETFDAVPRLAAERCSSASAKSVLRVLTLPCSSGEEPYSIAMALLDAGVPADRFRIDAVDISSHAIANGQRAVYAKNSFRGEHIDFRDRHFAQRGDGYALSDAVRQQVRFHQANLFDACLLSDQRAYDFVFCRNLLIYFDRPTQERALDALDRLLSEDGCLFVGAAETGLLTSRGMISAGLPMAFAFRREACALRADEPAPRSKPTPVVPLRPHTRSRATPPPPAPMPRTPAAASRQQAADSAIERATQMADQGRLAEAMALCEETLRQAGPSAAVFCLMGVICDAKGDNGDAGHYYRKALYLEPVHHESLAHLAALLESQGDTAGAQRLRQRAQRAHAEAKT